MSNVLQQIVAFNEARNLKNFDAVKEHLMLSKEQIEFVEATVKHNEYEQVDALADIIVFATGALHKMGYDPEAVLSETLKEINSREGAVDESTGKWEKNPNQDPSTLYKAIYTKK